MILKVNEFKNAKELKEGFGIWKALYGDDQEPFEITLKWWSNYHKSFLKLTNGNNILGTFCVLPLSRSEFKLFCQGKKLERELETLDLENNNQLTCEHWHISDVYLEEKIRDTYILKMLLKEAWRILQNDRHVLKQIMVSGIPHSKDGEKFALKMGRKKIREASEMPDKMPLYVGKITSFYNLQGVK